MKKMLEWPKVILAVFVMMLPFIANAGNFYWKAASNGHAPSGAFVAGSENGGVLVLCRAKYKGGLHPGKIVNKNCNFGWGGKEILSSSYQVLVYQGRHRWVSSSGGHAPSGAFVAGSEPGGVLVLCRAKYKGGLHPGKIVNKNCNFGWGGKEILGSKYQVLILK